MADVLYPSQITGMPPFSEQEWAPSSTSFIDNVDYSSPFVAPQATQVFPSPIPDYSSGPSKTQTSPNTFSDNVEDVFFTTNPLGIKHESEEDSTLISSPRFTPGPPSPYFGSFGVSKIHSSASKPAPVPIAPEPSGIRQTQTSKRSRDDDDVADTAPKRRKRATSNATQTELNEEEALLLKLKDEENLPWKDIALRFQTGLGKHYQVPALQMRLKRLRERMRVWTERDVEALEQAYKYWEQFRFDIISAKVVFPFEVNGWEYGSAERWPAKYCSRKWEELHPDCFAQIPRAQPLRGVDESTHDSPELVEAQSPGPSLKIFDDLRQYTP
ncbi:MAG: hypothetical protein M1830_000265 [Pleopsidium flavum]|nr:MAG: hypothetical protein M1830_000265 [Pleopsidium flavum]